jgi:hypothetical protein
MDACADANVRRTLRIEMEVLSTKHSELDSAIRKIEFRERKAQIDKRYRERKRRGSGSTEPAATMETGT